MALWSRVMVNEDAVGWIEVQRLSPTDGGLPEPGTLCRYRWSVGQYGDFGNEHVERRGELDHPYGAWVTLYAAVLEAAAERGPL